MTACCKIGPWMLKRVRHDALVVKGRTDDDRTMGSAIGGGGGRGGGVRGAWRGGAAGGRVAGQRRAGSGNSPRRGHCDAWHCLATTERGWRQTGGGREL